VDPRLTFDGVAETYHAIRPGYPTALFDELFAVLPTDPLVLEVGPGTGQATRNLLARGATVHAVELGSNLAAALRRELPSARLAIEIGDFERVPAGEATYDGVFSASAYHWIDPRLQVDRPAALLKPGGVLAVVGLVQVDAPEDRGFFASAQPIYERHGLPHEAPPAPARPDVDSELRARLEAEPRFEDVRVHRYDWDQTYTAAGYRSLQETYSTTQLMPPDARRALLRDLESFIREHFDDRVTRPLVATLTLARRASPPVAPR
jgi:SAM-dependent methyltransferase